MFLWFFNHYFAKSFNKGINFVMKCFMSVLLLALSFCETIYAQYYTKDGYPDYIIFTPKSRVDSVYYDANGRFIPIFFKSNSYNVIQTAVLDSVINSVHTALIRRNVRLAHVWVSSSASPEGKYWNNVILAKNRSNAVAKYLQNKAKIPRHVLNVVNLEEDWTGFTKRLEKDDSIPHREQILKIIREEPVYEKRKNKIKALDRYATWNYLIKDIFPDYRTSRIAIICYEEMERYIIPNKPVYPDFSYNFVSLTHNNYPVNLKVEKQPKYLFAVKTNAIFLSALIFNIGVEARLSDRLSIDIPFYYSPYNLFRTDRKIRVLGTQPELRLWTKEVMNGHFWGLHGHIAGFNIALNNRGRYQDPNRALWGLGVGYGYAKPFGRDKRFGIEFNAGFGFANYKYDSYYNWENGTKFDTNEKTYWGITRAGVSLSYKFFSK